MAQVNLFRFDSDGFPIEHDPAADDATFLSLTAGAGGISSGGDLAMGGNQITGIGDATAGDHAVSLDQLSAVSSGIDYKDSVRAATTADLSATYASGGGAGGTGQFTGAPTAIDGVTLVAGDRVLVKNQTSGDENGIYVVTATTTTWDRAADADEDAEVTDGLTTWVGEGTANADTRWTQTANDPVTLNTTSLVFVQTAGGGAFVGGDGIDIAGSTISVDLRTDSGLAFFTGELGVNLEATNPSLQIVSNELGVKFAATTSGLVKDANGLRVLVDGTTIQINGSGELEVIGGGTVDQYTLTAATGGVTVGDPVFVSANDEATPCDNTDNNTRRYVGVATATAVATASFAVQQEGVLSGATIDGSPSAGDVVWLDTPSGLTVTLPTGSGTHRLVIGKMKNATEMIIEPQYVSRIR